MRIIGLFLFTFWCSCGVFAGEMSLQGEADNNLKQGNYRDALVGYRKLLADKTNEKASLNFASAVRCLRSLGRLSEFDGLVEEVVRTRPNDFLLLWSVAENIGRQVHYGYLVGGAFRRGYGRQKGRYVSAQWRDRVWALRFFERARLLIDGSVSESQRYSFYVSFADVVLGSGEAWRLQSLTDFTALPDYEEVARRYYGGGFGLGGAPVDALGKPLFYAVPNSLNGAANDGERWQWLLEKAASINSKSRANIQRKLANFYRNQFGVQTMVSSGFRGRSALLEPEDDGAYSVHTLGEGETIARLATGIKRFVLPNQYNHIYLMNRVISSDYAEVGDYRALAEVYKNRRQYNAAAVVYEKAMARFGENSSSLKIEYGQIVNNWGRLEPGTTLPAGTNPRLPYRFRNGKLVNLTAHALKVKALVEDMKSYMKSNPKQLDWNKISINQLGRNIVSKNEAKYLGKQVASWDVKLSPAKNHYDRLQAIEVPVKAAGAYLIVAKMAAGNTSRIVLWLDDTVIVQKRLDNKLLYLVTDAVSGKPLANMDVELFGYKQDYIRNAKRGARRYNVNTVSRKLRVNEEGMLIVGSKLLPKSYRWMVIASGGGRYAVMNFNHYWFSNYRFRDYKQDKTYVVTDRPVYRPGQDVNFKAWIRKVEYTLGEVSTYAARNYLVEIRNAKNEKVYSKRFTTDSFAGLDGVFKLPEDAALGSYSLRVHSKSWNQFKFRVEEYKKPEYEVTVEGPKAPVALGKKVDVTIKARYFFGAPVTHAKVKYKVLRYAHEDRWFPVGNWDWLYGKGYGWFGLDYDWYPGWRRWGCRRPSPWWWPKRTNPPEVVLENRVEIGEDGTVKFQIDSSVAKAMFGDKSCRYEITAEVVDRSRRTIVGSGSVIAAAQPFRVNVWGSRGFYRVNAPINVSVQAHSADKKPVAGKGEATLYRLTYDGKGVPTETRVNSWSIETSATGKADLRMTAAKAGQYRLSCKIRDRKGVEVEGGYLFTVRGVGVVNSGDFRYNALELVVEKSEYRVGEKVKLLINTAQADSTVLLFTRAENGVGMNPRLVQVEGKSSVVTLTVTQADMPNFFVEAVTVSAGLVHTVSKQIVVPPEKRVVNVEVLPGKAKYKPGEKAEVKIRLTDFMGKPITASTVMTVYDKSVEYISGGSNVPEIRAFFWKWTRNHYPQTVHSLSKSFYQLRKNGEAAMGNLGVFGSITVGATDKLDSDESSELRRDAIKSKGIRRKAVSKAMMSAPGGEALAESAVDFGESPATSEVTIRKKFADTAFWSAKVTPDKGGVATVSLDMPENLTTWKISAWSMGQGSRVGQGSAEVITSKDFIIRMQAPRFFVEKDEVVLSANVHNYLDKAQKTVVTLRLSKGVMEPMEELVKTVTIPAGGETRVDWRVRAIREGEAKITMIAKGQGDGDAMEMDFPVYVHGMMKQVPVSGNIRPEGKTASYQVKVPAARRVEQSRLELRYSPTLAGALVDALPYLVEYPYGCTEQTLNRFVPTVITQSLLKRMGVDLADVKKAQTNLNAQELGDTEGRAKQWKHWMSSPVFDEKEVDKMVRSGLKRLGQMQLSDGGWGWFSGHGERAYPHTTAVVVKGLLLARANGVKVNAAMVNKGVDWLRQYQQKEVQKLDNEPTQTKPYKSYASNVDALVFFVLTKAGVSNKAMLEYLYRDRLKLSVYAMAMYGMALDKLMKTDKVRMVLSNIEQYLVEDNTNQTAYLNLPNDGYWWSWYGSEYEAHAYYLKLLSATQPKSAKAAGLVKYLLNNRKHANYWNSTRDTALCIEALADYMIASGEEKPDMEIEVRYDGRLVKTVKVNSSNLFTFDNKFVLTGKAVTTGLHKVEIRRKGKGPVYFNSYLNYFSLEAHISKAGLEVKVSRKFYKLEKVAKSALVKGGRGQAVNQKVEAYKRVAITADTVLKSGDLVEVEMLVDSKNDYEYLLLKDRKAAGFEPVNLRSGYNGNELGAFVEFRDEEVCFFINRLKRGRYSVTYRMRAEIPGKFSALPAKIEAMYAPELMGNSDEMKIRIED